MYTHCTHVLVITACSFFQSYLPEIGFYGHKTKYTGDNSSVNRLRKFYEFYESYRRWGKFKN